MTLSQGMRAVALLHPVPHLPREGVRVFPSCVIQGTVGDRWRWL